MANDIFPPDFTTDVGKVRSLIADTMQLDYDESDRPRYRIPDNQIESFLEISEGKIYAAAASALISIAVNEALISKVIKTEDLQTDGAKLATELRLNARDLFNKQKELDDIESGKRGDSFVYMPMQYPFRNPDW